MSVQISDRILALLDREADIAAARLVRRLQLPSHYREDVRHDLLVDLFIRLKDFDLHRGTLAAFAAIVIRHSTTRLAGRIRLDCRMHAPVSLDDPQPGTDGVTVGDTIAESGGYLAMMGQPTDRFVAADCRLDLDRALGTLRQADLDLCAHLINRTPTQLSGDGLGSRAGLYRQIHEIRLRLMTGGISAVA